VRSRLVGQSSRSAQSVNPVGRPSRSAQSVGPVGRPSRSAQSGGRSPRSPSSRQPSEAPPPPKASSSTARASLGQSRPQAVAESRTTASPPAASPPTARCRRVAWSSTGGDGFSWRTSAFPVRMPGHSGPLQPRLPGRYQKSVSAIDCGVPAGRLSQNRARASSAKKRLPHADSKVRRMLAAFEWTGGDDER
jgi:hypothetical protein